MSPPQPINNSLDHRLRYRLERALYRVAFLLFAATHRSGGRTG